MPELSGAVVAAWSGDGSADAGERPSEPELRIVGDGNGRRDDAGRHRLIVADDADAIRMLLRTILELEPDFELVGEACDGLEAIELVQRHEVDLLLVDLSMPVLDGLETIQRLRASHPQLRVVVYTGHASPQIEARAKALGASDVVLKGTLPDELLARLRQAMR